MNQTMKQYDTLFKRYWDEADYYARLYGIDPKDDTVGAWDAFRHAYASAAMSRERSPWMAHAFGDANEIMGDRYQSQPLSDYDRNSIYEGELPPPPNAPAKTGPTTALFLAGEW